MNYKNAFKCRKCPKSSDENGCPAWNQIVMTNASTGEQKVEAGCFFQMMPALMVECIKASNTAANTHADVKSEVARGFSVLAGAMPGLVEAIADTASDDEPKLVTEGEGH